MGRWPTFAPTTECLPEPQRRVFGEITEVPRHFVLYGGTAITLRLGHRTSIDFDFFSNDQFRADALERTISLLRDGVRTRSEPNTLVSVVDRGGPVSVSFFGGLPLRRVGEPEAAGDGGPLVASLLDLAATKAKVVQDRAEAKDYFDLDRLMVEGLSLGDVLAAALAVYGPTFNPLLTLKALAYFEDGDLRTLAPEIRGRLTAAVRATGLETIHPAMTLPGGLVAREGS